MAMTGSLRKTAMEEARLNSVFDPLTWECRSGESTRLPSKWPRARIPKTIEASVSSLLFPPALFPRGFSPTTLLLPSSFFQFIYLFIFRSFSIRILLRLQQAQRATSGIWFSPKIKQIFVFHFQFIFIWAHVDRCSPTILEDSHLCLIWIVHARSQVHATIRAKWFLSRYNHHQLTIPASLSSNIDGQRASYTLKNEKGRRSLRDY